MPLVAIIFLAAVVAVKLIFGWNTAWNVGGFFVALVTGEILIMTLAIS